MVSTWAKHMAMMKAAGRRLPALMAPSLSLVRAP